MIRMRRAGWTASDIAMRYATAHWPAILAHRQVSTENIPGREMCERLGMVFDQDVLSPP